MFSIGTPIVRLIKTPKCKDIKRNAFLWCRVTEKNSGTGAKIFDEKVVGPGYRFMMEILSKDSRFLEREMMRNAQSNNREREYPFHSCLVLLAGMGTSSDLC